MNRPPATATNIAAEQPAQVHPTIRSEARFYSFKLRVLTTDLAVSVGDMSLKERIFFELPRGEDGLLHGTITPTDLALIYGNTR